MWEDKECDTVKTINYLMGARLIRFREDVIIIEGPFGAESGETQYHIELQ